MRTPLNSIKAGWFSSPSYAVARARCAGELAGNNSTVTITAVIIPIDPVSLAAIGWMTCNIVCPPSIFAALEALQEGILSNGPINSQVRFGARRRLQTISQLQP